jgi:hypothetical protein
VKKLEMVCCLRLRFCEDGGDDCDELSGILVHKSSCGLPSRMVNAKKAEVSLEVWIWHCKQEVAMNVPMPFERMVLGCTLL